MFTRLAACFILLAPLVSATSAARIEFDNRSGSPAQVKIVGRSVVVVDVPDRTSVPVPVAAGDYYILIRYGVPGHYRFTQGRPFGVAGREVVRITLHPVAGGNYRTAPVGPEAYSAAR
jgi:hypothetical protein